MHRRVVEPNRVFGVAGQRIAVAARLAEGAARVEQAREAGRRVAADRIGQTHSGGVAQRQRQSGATGQCGGAATGAQDHAAVLGARATGADLDGTGGRGPDRQHLVEHDALTQSFAQRLDARPGADHAGVLVQHRGVLPRRQQRQALGDLGGVDLTRSHPGVAHRLEPPQRGGAERDHAVAREQLPAEPLLPLAPPAARVAGELDQTAVVMGVAEDPRLPAGLAIAREPAVVHGHGGAQFGQRVRRREPDDPGPDHPDVGVSAQRASRAL